MKWNIMLKAGLKSIMKNRMRSTLTMLGMIIGVGSVIALLSLGAGTQATVLGEIGSLGTNLLIIIPGSGELGGVSRGAGSLNTLSMDDVSELRERCSLLENVSPVIGAARQVIAGGNNWSTSISGVSPTYLAIRNWTLESGTFFTERAVKSKAKVAVLGRTVAYELFPDQDPIGERIRIGNVPFKVIGVLSEKGQAMNGKDQDDVILAPSTAVLYRLSDGETVHVIMASADSPEAIGEAKEQVSEVLRAEHKLSAGEEDDFSVRSQTEIIEMASTVTGLLTLLLGSIAGVSLVVGGIGIMNIMLVSVTERTREIGIRLALGAREGDVLKQFLMEAVTLSFIGGVFGIAFGVGIGSLIGSAIGIPIVVSPVTVSMAFLVSAAVGVFFGFYPAKKASRLDPILALHYE